MSTQNAIEIAGRLLAFLTAKEGVERYVCEEYALCVGRVQQAILAPEPASKDKKPKAMSKKGNRACNMPEGKSGANGLSTKRNEGEIQETHFSSGFIEFPASFENLLEWSTSYKAKEQEKACFSVKDARLVRRRICRGEKYFLERFHEAHRQSGSGIAHHIQDMQMHMNKLAQSSSGKLVGTFLRLAPGSRIASHRNVCMTALLKRYEYVSLVDLKGRRLPNKRVQLYKEIGVACIGEEVLKESNIFPFGTSFVSYKHPEQLVRIGELIYQINTTFLRRRLESIVGDIILSRSEDDDISSWKLAHALLYKRGRSSLVIARRQG